MKFCNYKNGAAGLRQSNPSLRGEGDILLTVETWGFQVGKLGSTEASRNGMYTSFKWLKVVRLPNSLAFKCHLDNGLKLI